MNLILALWQRMPKRERIALLILAAILFLALANLAIRSIPFGANSTPGGRYTEGFVGKIQSLNPLFADFNDADRDISELVFSGLMQYDPVARNFVPDLAESWSRSRNALDYTFTLREHLYWHDGTPLSIDDVLYTFKYVVLHPDFRNPIIGSAFEGVSIEKTGDRSITFTLPKTNSYFISQLTVGILPEHLLIDEPVATLRDAEFDGIGSGPFRIKNVKSGQDGDIVDLERFEGYYGEIPRITKIRFMLFRSERELLVNLGELHGVSKISRTEWENQSRERFVGSPYHLNQFTALYFNTDHPQLQKKSVRRGMLRALDKNSLVAQNEDRIDTITLETLPTDLNFQQNLEHARAALASAELTMGSKGFLEDRKGNSFSLTLLTLEQTPQTVTDALEKQWKAVGIELVTVRKDPVTFAQHIQEGRYDLLLIRQNLGYNRDTYPIFHSSQIQGLNFSRFKSFRTDGLTEAIRKETIPADKEKLLRELSEAIGEEVPIIFLSTPVYYYAIDSSFGAFPEAVLDYHSDRLTTLIQ